MSDITEIKTAMIPTTLVLHGVSTHSMPIRRQTRMNGLMMQYRVRNCYVLVSDINSGVPFVMGL